MQQAVDEQFVGVLSIKRGKEVVEQAQVITEVGDGGVKAQAQSTGEGRSWSTSIGLAVVVVAAALVSNLFLALSHVQPKELLQVLLVEEAKEAIIAVQVHLQRHFTVHSIEVDMKVVEVKSKHSVKGEHAS